MASLMFIAATLIVDSKIGADVVVKNTSEKIITAFSYTQEGAVSYSEDLRNIEGIKPGQTYEFKVPVEDSGVLITGVVFWDETSEGEAAKEILARRQGIRRAEIWIASQIREFLKYNTVIDDNSLAVLDREVVDNNCPVPGYLSVKEKSAWKEGYVSTRQTIRQRIKEVPETHRLQQLKQIGRAK